MPSYQINGYAIVSDNDCIADRHGNTPPELRNAADWERFQIELDRAVLSIIGRRGHEANPNLRHRARLIVSRSVDGVERKDDGWWWNPGRASLREALSKAAPDGGMIAVPGGRQVNDLVLSLGFDAFHLTRKRGVVIDGGVPVFSRAWAVGSAERLLASHGLHPGKPIELDPAEHVSTVIWSR
jgi:hypothetical protein